jgi:hypothetical protein
VSQLGRTLSGFAVLCLLVFQVASGLTAEAATYEITLSEPRVNVLDDGRTPQATSGTIP